MQFDPRSTKLLKQVAHLLGRAAVNFTLLTTATQTRRFRNAKSQLLHVGLLLCIAGVKTTQRLAANRDAVCGCKYSLARHAHAEQANLSPFDSPLPIWRCPSGLCRTA